MAAEYSYIFKGGKGLYVKLPNQILAKMVQANEKVCKLKLNGWAIENKEYCGELADGITGGHWHFFSMILVELFENLSLHVLMS